MCQAYLRDRDARQQRCTMPEEDWIIKRRRFYLSDEIGMPIRRSLQGKLEPSGVDWTHVTRAKGNPELASALLLS